MKAKILFAALGGALVAGAAETNETVETTSSVNTNGELHVLVLADPIYQSYKTQKTESYSRIATDPMELAGSVNQVSQKLINDTGANSVKEMVKHVPGVFNFLDEQHLYSFSKFHIRGVTQSNSWRDGMRNYGNNVVDLDSLESFDVVKGPNSVTSGYADVGGYINYVTKGASLDDDSYRNQLTVRASNTGLWKTTAETGGKVTDRLATYFQAGYQDGETFRNREKEVLTFTGGVAVKLTEDTTLDLRGTYTHENRDPDYGVPFVDGKRVGGLHKYWNRYGGYDGLEIDDLYTVATLTHDFTENLKSHTRVSFHEYRCDMDALRFPSWNSAQKTFLARHDASDMSLFEMQGNQDIEWDWHDLDWLDNKLLVGFEGHVNNYRWHRRWYNNAAKIDWTRSRYVANGSPSVLAGTAQRTNWYSFAPYFQEHLELFDQLHLMGGLRWDWLDKENRAAGSKNYDAVDHENRLSGNVGVLWEMFDFLHPYASYSTSFNPQMPGTTLESGSNAKPELGEQFEVGAKIPVGDDLQLGVCWYHITKKNVARAIGMTGYYDIDGEYESQGVELSAQGQLGDYVEVMAAYSWNEAEARKVASTSKYHDGSQLTGVPKHAGSVWAVWHMDGVKSPYGFRAGLGVEAMTSRHVDEAGTSKLGGYATLNAVAGYGWEYMGGRLADVQLNLYNLTDKEYYDSASNGTDGNYWATPGAPFGGQITLRFTF